MVASGQSSGTKLSRTPSGAAAVAALAVPHLSSNQGQSPAPSKKPKKPQLKVSVKKKEPENVLTLIIKLEWRLVIFFLSFWLCSKFLSLFSFQASSKKSSIDNQATPLGTGRDIPVKQVMEITCMGGSPLNGLYVSRVWDETFSAVWFVKIVISPCSSSTLVGEL